MGYLGTKRKAPAGPPPAPAHWDNSGALHATHWPIGVPARQGTQPFDMMGEISADVPGTRAGGFAPPADGSEFPPFHSATFERNVALQPYDMVPTVPSVSKNVGPGSTLAGGPGATPYTQPMEGNFPANFNYVWRSMGANREAWILPRLDGNRHVPNAVQVNPAMAGDVGTYTTAYTLNTYVGQYPSPNSGSYVTTPGQGTTSTPGVSGIPDNVVMANDQLSGFNPLQVFL